MRRCAAGSKYGKLSGKYQYECPSSDSKYLYPAASETLPKMLALSSSRALVSIASYLLGTRQGSGQGCGDVEMWGGVYSGDIAMAAPSLGSCHPYAAYCHLSPVGVSHATYSSYFRLYLLTILTSRRRARAESPCSARKRACGRDAGTNRQSRGRMRALAVRAMVGAALLRRGVTTRHRSGRSRTWLGAR